MGQKRTYTETAEPRYVHKADVDRKNRDIADEIDRAISGGLIPSGNLDAAGLASLVPSALNLGHMYNVTVQFVADERFAENERGNVYPSGSNIYVARKDNLGTYTYFLDVLQGASQTVTIIAENITTEKGYVIPELTVEEVITAYNAFAQQRVLIATPDETHLFEITNRNILSDEPQIIVMYYGIMALSYTVQMIGSEEVVIVKGKLFVDTESSQEIWGEKTFNDIVTTKDKLSVQGSLEDITGSEGTTGQVLQASGADTVEWHNK